MCVAADLEPSHCAVRQGASDGGEDGSDVQTSHTYRQVAPLLLRRKAQDFAWILRVKDMICKEKVSLLKL